MSDLSERDREARQWLAGVLGGASFELAPAAADASFRRYLRVTLDGGTRILMDAPPGREDCGRYADLARRLRALGLHTPDIHAADPVRGFLLIEDFGTRHYLDALDADQADRLYGDALAALLTLQSAPPLDGLPLYDAPFLHRELRLFEDWFLRAYLGLPDEPTLRTAFADAGDRLIASALEQPQATVHRDFHSRNLMLTAVANPGILDFQDAVIGPVTYDPVSLLRDCYIAWPAERVTAWALGYFAQARQAGLLRDADAGQWLRWFDLMGVQRHLKACGIFARLHLRDGKPQYLGDIPRTLGYVLEVARRYPELGGLRWLIEERLQAGMPGGINSDNGIGR